ncbi:MAG: Homoserine O-acetyltransferase [Lentisphaerae bacterium ADurb.BinA184]|nr:MAG: Homoserine O-acetyltransferase [Lentisphaerae bacterium ADurb.BinA184]
MSQSASQDNSAVGSVGVVESRRMRLYDADDPLRLDSGATLAPVDVEYETYGRLDAEAGNAVLICHALSGDAHAAGLHAAGDEKPGWWDTLIGPGKGFDTERYFVICANVLGGCKGTTGPQSVNPATGKPYGLDFPVVTIHDMVTVQKRLIDRLGVRRLLTVCGGSMGGMQALEWSVSYPEAVRSAIPVASTYRTSPQSIALNEVGRQAILRDPNFRRGQYYDGAAPNAGLSLARMIGHITYLSDQSMHEKFGRDLRHRKAYGYDFEPEFAVQTYLHYHGERFTKRFDANSYLYITKAMDYFDLSQGYPSLRKSLARAAGCKFLFVSFSSDWLFPSYQTREAANALRNSGIDVTFVELQSDYGHDAFLLEVGEMTKIISAFLGYLGGVRP